jgi:hypothetical protein
MANDKAMHTDTAWDKRSQPQANQRVTPGNNTAIARFISTSSQIWPVCD